MRSLIIWSKDRAFQLDGLLSSLMQNASQLFDKIDVLYLASNDDFQSGYEEVMEDHKDDRINLWNRVDSFENMTKAALSDLPINSNVAFSTDDNLVYRPVGEVPVVKYGETFSLRLGLNTVVQNHTTGEIQPPLNNYVEKDGIISWRPDQYHPLSNYGYPMALDLHLYATSQIHDIISRFNFKNSNELEGNLVKFRNEVTVIKAFRESCAVNFPMNCLSGYTQSENIDAKYLNRLYLSGKRMNLDSIKSSNTVVGCHQVLKGWL